MSKRKETDKASSAGTETATPLVAEAGPASPAQQDNLALPAPVKAESPAPEPVADSVEISKPIEAPKPITMPRPVEVAFKAIEAMKPAASPPLPDLTVAPSAAAAAPVQAPTTAPSTQSRSHRFALLAASVAFAGAFGAMAGALTAAVIARPAPPPVESPLAALDLTSVQDSIAGLRTELSSIASMRAELSSIKSGVDTSSRNSNAQFAKFTERLDRIERAQAAPAAQLKQAMDAIERLERRAQNSGQGAAETIGSVRPQPAAVTPPATPPVTAPVTAVTPPAAEPPRPTVLDGWVVRHVSRGVAVIQGRRMGLIEVETGDVVPGVGRIESIRRQDGRWVVVTSKGMITSPQPR